MLALACTLLPNGPAIAQKLESLEPVSGLTVIPSVGVRYEDNLFRNDSAITPEVEEIIVDPAIKARFGKDLGGVDAQFQAKANYEIYTRSNGVDKLGLDFAGQVKASIAGACSVRPYGRFRRQRADYGDINGTRPNVQNFSTALIEVDCKRVAGVFPFASAARIQTKNDNLFRASNQTAWSYAGGVGLTEPSLGTITAYYMHLISDRTALNFKNKVDRVGATIERAVVSHLSIYGDVHWLNVSSTDSAIRDYSGIGWEGALFVRPVPMLLLRADTKREIANDPIVPAGYSINTGYTLLARGEIGDKLELGVACRWLKRRFVRNPLVVISSIDSDRQFMPSADVTYRVTSRITVDGSVTHVRRRTNSNFNNYNANIAALTLSTRY